MSVWLKSCCEGRYVSHCSRCLIRNSIRGSLQTVTWWYVAYPQPPSVTPHPHPYFTMLCPPPCQQVAPPLPLLSFQSSSPYTAYHCRHSCTKSCIVRSRSTSLCLHPTCALQQQCSQPANRPRSLFNLSINIKYDTVGSVDLILQKVSGAERCRLKLSQFMSLNYYNMQRINNMWSWAAMCFLLI